MEKLFKDSDGKEWLVWVQDLPQSCAAAACYMTIALYKQQSLSGGEEGFIREMMFTGSQWTDFSLQKGKGNLSMNQIAQILVDAGLKVDSNVTENADFLKKIALAASEKNPAIMNVGWYKGGAHQVVCVGPTKKKTTFIFLDPLCGLVEQDFAVYPNYSSVLNTNLAQPQGAFTGWYAKTYR